MWGGTCYHRLVFIRWEDVGTKWCLDKCSQRTKEGMHSHNTASTSIGHVPCNLLHLLENEVTLGQSNNTCKQKRNIDLKLPKKILCLRWCCRISEFSAARAEWKRQ